MFLYHATSMQARLEKELEDLAGARAALEAAKAALEAEKVTGMHTGLVEGEGRSHTVIVYHHLICCRRTCQNHLRT
jgi:hypothetical protein